MARKKGKALPSPDQMLDAALELAREDGWEDFRMSEVALALDIGLGHFQAVFRDKDAIANAWFHRAQSTMLAEAGPKLWRQPVKERLYRLLECWFDALAREQNLTRQMLAAKLYPGHPHHWSAAIFDLSRFIQGLRDAAAMTAGGRQRQIEEVALSLLLLERLHFWCRDRSDNQERTMTGLRRRLEAAEAAMLGTSRRR